MPLLKQSKILFDNAHNEMLNINDDDFSEFKNLIQRLGFTIVDQTYDVINKDVLNNLDVFVIGNPISSYFSNVEINIIVDFVREGGNLLVISEYGSDFLQKTNLNDLLGTNFGIFFEKNIIKGIFDENQNCTSILSIQNFEDNKITNQLREVIVGGTCSFILNRLANPLLVLKGFEFWSEEYNSVTEKWVKEEQISSEKHGIVAAYREYGRGKIIALGDIDIFTNDSNIGINIQDNRKFITNIFNWLIEPIKDSSVRFWALDQLGTFQNDLKDIKLKINNLIETMTFLEERISVLEYINKIQEEKKELSNVDNQKNSSTF
ncbi:MAG: hypothetical protein ACFFAT_11350 [Promethearchaeota archaeon]